MLSQIGLTKRMKKYIVALIIVSVFHVAACSHGKPETIQTGAEQTSIYLPLIKNKKCALTANHTSTIGFTHLVDSLLKLQIRIVKIFSPEHGFRGTVTDGEFIKNTVDAETGIPIVSLYGIKKKPSADDLKDIDIMIYDIQDVGVRFYTYISTLHYIMEACAENDILLIILDRPNPNGFYIDGPVLESPFKSFVGMHPIPIVYGLTVGELAMMINGEGWLGNGLKCNLKVIPCIDYTHKSLYRLPVNPSPNLRNMEAVYLYPSIGLFEGTIMNVGRGTPFPFQVFGHPDYLQRNFSYTPASTLENRNPKHKGLRCYGNDLRNLTSDSLVHLKRINLSWIILAYQTMQRKDFFNAYFTQLAGTEQLRKQIEAGWTEEKIRQSWQTELEKYRQMRKKYLLYPD
jgi:uncharacterized protein YbbC (DUF1343 family)